MDEVYDALDSFNHASKVAFEQNDIELEARCEAWLGKIYQKCLKKNEKAITHYNSVIRLANSLRPRDVTQTQWYRDAKTSLDSIREARRLDEEATQDKKDKPFRDLVAEDIRKVKEEAKKGDCAKFLKFLNTDYVPEDKRGKLKDEMLSEDKLKRTMTIHFAKIFHPDRNVNATREKQILCEEIMKLINIFMEEFK